MYISADPCWQKDWRSALARGDKVPLEQAWGYGDAVAKRYGAKISRLFVYREPSTPPIACVQVIQKMYAGQILRGPVFLNAPTLQEIQDIITLLRRQYSWRREGLTLWFPDLADTTEHRQILKKSRLFRVQSGYQTAFIDLSYSLEDLLAACRTPWRQDLKQALKVPHLEVVRVSQHNQLTWFLDAHEDFRKTARIKAPSQAFLRELYQNFLPHKEAFILLAQHNGSYQAGIMVLIHGNTATYFAGVTSPEGRKIKSHHRLIWHALGLLKQQGVRWFDLCGLNVKTMAGVTHFKRGLGGKEVQLCGTYV